MMSNSWSRPYCRTTWTRSGWLKTLPKVRNHSGTIAITPFSFYFSRLGKGGRQDCQEVPQGFIQLLCRKRPESCGGLCERLRRWLDGERYWHHAFSHMSYFLGLQLKYGATAMSYCPILDKKITNWEKNDKGQAFKFFTQYCATKGKKC